MFLSSLTFEWRYYIRQPSFYVVATLFFLLSFLSVASNNVVIGGGGEVMKNSAYNVALAVTVMTFIAMFAVVNFIGSTAIRNHQHQMEELVYSKPLNPLSYQLGRLLGSYAVVLTTFAFIPLGLLLGTFMPWLDQTRLGPVELYYYIQPFFVIAVPSLFLISVMFYAMANRFRSLMALYLTAVAMLVLYNIAGELFSQPQYREMAAMLDPFGRFTFAEITRYWTIAEKNTQVLPLEGLLLQNRLIWLALALVILFVSGIAKQPTLSKKKDKKAGKVETAPELKPLAELARSTSPNNLAQFVTRVKFEVRQVIFSAPFLVLGLLTVFNLVGPMFDDFGWYGTSNWPLTAAMVSDITGATSLLMVIILIYYSGEIVWRERTSGMGDIIDSLPVKNISFWTSKLLAVAMVMASLYVISMVTTILFQLLKGQGHLELSQYAIRLSYFYLLPLLMSAVMAFFLQVLSPNKYMGMALFVAYFLTTFIMANWGLGHSLYNFSASPTTSYSDLNQYGISLASHSWYMLYWGAFSTILFVIGFGLYHRGPKQPLKARFKSLGYQIGFTGKATIAASLIVFISTGSFLYYQTNVVNSYQTRDESLDSRADYEKDFKQFQSLPLLTTTKVNANVNIFPQERMIEADFDITWQNRSGHAIDKILVSLPSHTRIEDLAISIPNASLGEFESKYDTAWLTFSKPVKPAETVQGTIQLTRKTVGIEESGIDYAVLQNGTFINNASLLPSFGYNENAELSDRHERTKRGLEEKARSNKLEDENFHHQNFFGVDGNFIKFETTVSTSGNQIALAPGYLQREWQQDGRNYFHYKMDKPMVNFYAFISAKYEVKKEQYKGINIEVYHHPTHKWNVDRMIESVKDSIDYFSESFGPYQHKQMRIMEFPAYRSFAQSFANTVPYSESIGFITDLRDPDNIDPVYYVTAHEVAHQWWGHQVGAANVQGSAVISESLSQYAALMVLEKKYGKNMLRKFMKHELDRYLRGRSNERIKEMPLLRSENQSYIHYQKGSVIMMALKDALGEARLNANLKAFLERYKYRNDPYPTTLDLVSYIKSGLNEEQARLVDNSFNEISIYDLRVQDAQIAKLDNGNYQVDMTVFASRKSASGKGEETEQQLDNLIDIGIFSHDPEKLTDDAQVLLLEKHHIMSGENKLSFEVKADSEPKFLGVDPFIKLVDRDSKDNIYKL
ncbi:ABC transporter permease [Shewanella sp. 202IG2-18]|uniref:ABC transporter permease/M1 family aminopeptidase n=1 Tax=Parashewanella hymeniacidonis TaxID=2807618 RepID=UPI00195F3F12|nr:M1 family aminopeptidase [Parashewanella hymeniacidonis]MBM7072646.1 ABC transporter permease [Parashewanella hymeniacidonis]